MKNYRCFFALGLLLLLLLSMNAAIAAEKIQDVSLIQLIANPEKYDGKTVRVSGYFHNKFEDHNLYLGKEDADLLRTMNAVGVETSKDVRYEPKGVSKSDVDCSEVILEGTYSATVKADFSPGSLEDVYRIRQHKPFYDGKRELEAHSSKTK